MCCVTSVVAVAVFGSAEQGGGASPGATGLEGSWMSGSASMSEYQNLATGEFAPPSGMGEAIELDGGGRCTHAAMLQSTLYSCTSYIFTFSDECQWSLDGTALTLEIGPGVVRSRMCGGEVKENPGKARTVRYAASLSVEDGNTWLTLVGEDQVSKRFRRER